MMITMDPTFVGEDRHDRLRDLVTAYDNVVRSGESRLVVLAGPTGWGKTRIVREFYAHLARDGAGDYWPPRLDADDGSWLQARKRVFPAPFEVSEQTAIPYLWLGISCQRDQMGRELSALQYAEQQFQAHVGPMATALEGTGDRWKARLGAAGAVAGLFGLPDPVSMAVAWHGIATSGWELVTGEWQSFRDRGAGARARRVETDDVAGATERAVELAEQMARLSGDDLPVVLVVDDAHWADRGTIAFIGKLLNTPGHILLVATAWPDQLAVQATETGTFGHALVPWIEAGRAERHELERLPDTALGRLIHEAADQVDPRVLRALCERADGNPNRLQGLMSLRVVRRALAADGTALTDGQIETLPAGDREIIMAIWRDLPEHVRDVLALSTLQGSEFNPDWIPAAAELLDLADAETGLAQAQSPWGWVRSLDSALAAFVEAGLFERAEEESRTLFLPDELARARAAMLRWAAEQKQQLDWETLSASARRAVLEAHFLGADQGFLKIDEDVADSALQLLEHLEESEELERHREVAERGVEWTEGKTESTALWWSFRHQLADSIVAQGHISEGLERYRTLVSEHARAIGKLDDAHLEMRYGLSWLLHLNGHSEEALAEVDDLLRVCAGHLGNHHETTLRARRRRGMILLKAGRALDAIEELEAVLETLASTRPSDDPDVLLVRSWRAMALGDARRVPEAISELEAVLEAQTRRVGRDHPTALTVRGHLGYALLDSRQFEEARDTFDALVADRLQILGPDHPGTLTTRGNLAMVYAELGETDQSVEMSRQLVEDRTRLLGPDHPDTLGTLGNLAITLHEAGRFEEALAVNRRLLDDRQRVLGNHHLDTIRGRYHVGLLLGETGKTDEAIALLMLLSDEMPTFMGWDHYLTLNTYVRLAEVLRDAGRAAEGREVLVEIVHRRSEDLGSTHFATFGARRQLAAWQIDTVSAQRDSAGVAEAVRELEILVQDHADSGHGAEGRKALSDALKSLESEGWDQHTGQFPDSETRSP